MEQAKNKVISGDYEGANVILDSGLVSISGIGNLSRDTVKSYEIITGLYQKVEFGLLPLSMLDDILADEQCKVHHLSIRFLDGKMSLLEVEPAFLVTIIKSCFARAPGSCGISLADISLTCDPAGRKNCCECPCSQCTLWPKCCFGRLLSRRAKRKI